MENAQLIVKHHRFELQGSTYTQISSSVNITVMYAPWLVESGDVAPRIWGPTIQLYTDFPLHGKSTHLTTTLLKGQLCILFFV